MMTTRKIDIAALDAAVSAGGTSQVTKPIEDAVRRPGVKHITSTTSENRESARGHGGVRP
jgi:hypothetical protein